MSAGREAGESPPAMNLLERSNVRAYLHVVQSELDADASGL